MKNANSTIINATTTNRLAPMAKALEYWKSRYETALKITGRKPVFEGRQLAAAEKAYAEAKRASEEDAMWAAHNAAVPTAEELLRERQRIETAGLGVEIGKRRERLAEQRRKTAEAADKAAADKAAAEAAKAEKAAFKAAYKAAKAEAKAAALVKKARYLAKKAAKAAAKTAAKAAAYKAAKKVGQKLANKITAAKAERKEVICMITKKKYSVGACTAKELADKAREEKVARLVELLNKPTIVANNGMAIAKDASLVSFEDTLSTSEKKYAKVEGKFLYEFTLEDLKAHASKLTEGQIEAIRNRLEAEKTVAEAEGLGGVEAKVFYPIANGNVRADLTAAITSAVKAANDGYDARPSLAKIVDLGGATAETAAVYTEQTKAFIKALCKGDQAAIEEAAKAMKIEYKAVLALHNKGFRKALADTGFVAWLRADKYVATGDKAVAAIETRIATLAKELIKGSNAQKAAELKAAKAEWQKTVSYSRCFALASWLIGGHLTQFGKKATLWSLDETHMESVAISFDPIEGEDELACATLETMWNQFLGTKMGKKLLRLISEIAVLRYPNIGERRLAEWYGKEFDHSDPKEAVVTDRTPSDFGYDRFGHYVGDTYQVSANSAYLDQSPLTVAEKRVMDLYVIFFGYKRVMATLKTIIGEKKAAGFKGSITNALFHNSREVYDAIMDMKDLFMSGVTEMPSVEDLLKRAESLEDFTSRSGWLQATVKRLRATDAETLAAAEKNQCKFIKYWFYTSEAGLAYETRYDMSRTWALRLVTGIIPGMSAREAGIAHAGSMWNKSEKKVEVKVDYAEVIINFLSDEELLTRELVAIVKDSVTDKESFENFVFGYMWDNELVATGAQATYLMDEAEVAEKNAAVKAEKAVINNGEDIWNWISSSKVGGYDDLKAIVDGYYEDRREILARKDVEDDLKEILVKELLETAKTTYQQIVDENLPAVGCKTLAEKVAPKLPGDHKTGEDDENVVDTTETYAAQAAKVSDSEIEAAAAAFANLF